MAVLNAARRKKIPNSEFGEPGERKFPMPDWQHAANAKSRAKQQFNKGRITRDEYDRIVARANRVMGHGR